MGCNPSKHEESNAVILCRQRSERLAEAVRQRYALADAHKSYADSLHSLAIALQTLLTHSQLSPLPAERNCDSFPQSSHSGSHIHFHSSDDSAANSPPSVSFERQLDCFQQPSALSSSWDFFNPFEGYCPTYTPSRSSKEVREDEDIPELEEDEQGAVKEEEVVEKNAFCGDLESRNEERSNLVAASRTYHDVFQVVGEIRVQFERAIESTKELDRLLEVGKIDYSKKSSFFAGCSRMMRVIQFFMVKDEDLVYEEDKVISSGKLSSILQKLYIWEQKLHYEVRVEERMRLLHDSNIKKLKRLDKRGAEAHKIEATETFSWKSSTKMRIAIQILNSTTTKINVIRDEELWPQIDGLIQCFERMWGVMLECHQIQRQAIDAATQLDSIATKGKASDELMNAIIHLEMELLSWITNFSTWINSQKNFVKALNSWLVLCLHYEPQATSDGIPPYSPGSIGAPTIFVILNCWSQALNSLSQKEAVDAIMSCSATINQLCQHNVMQLHQMSLNQSFESNSLHSSLKQLFQSMENFATSSMKAYQHIHATSSVNV